MPLLGNLIIILVFAIVLFLAVIAVIRGYKGMKISKQIDAAAKKLDLGIGCFQPYICGLVF